MAEPTGTTESHVDAHGNDDLADFRRTYFEAQAKARAVFRKGSGPAVIVISEMPGITPRVADFARRVVDAGFTAVMPHLFGEPGRPIGISYTLRSLAWGCTSREFAAFALRKTSPVIEWLRALARHEHERCGGRGVGVVGMCFTGNFALAMAADDIVMAPVMSQPSLPLALALPIPLASTYRRDVGASDADLARVQERCRDEPDFCVLGLRFTKDPIVPYERFAHLREALGDSFVAVEIDSSLGNSHGIPPIAHSVLAEHFVDEPGHPTRDALDKVLDLFRTQLP